MACPDCEQFEKLKTWLDDEIRSWKRVNAHSKHGLSEIGQGALEAFQMARIMAEDPAKLEAKLRRANAAD